MSAFNKVMLMGNLTRDPQLKYLPSQMAVAEFGLAVNRKFKSADGQSRDDVCFVDCAAFGKTGELINQYLTKGKPIFVEGRLKFDQWEDKNGGGKRNKITVVVENFQFIGGPNDSGGGGQSSGGPSYDESDAPPSSRPAPSTRPMARPTNQAPAPQAPNRPAAEQPFSEEQQFKEDDIPF